MMHTSRRQLLQHGLGLGAWLLVGEALATPPEMQQAMQAFAQNATIQTGRVQLEIAELIDNGNTVPVTIRVQSPMTADNHVRAIALFAEKNPQSQAFEARMNHLAGRAQVSTRIRLANSQTIVALARMNDGSCWMHRVQVIVTIAACIEDDDV